MNSQDTRRRNYVRLYIIISLDGSDCRRDTDGSVCAYTEWDQANKLAAKTAGLVVVNWPWFKTRVVKTLVKTPDRMRIYDGDNRTYIAAMDATEDELRTLNVVSVSQLVRSPEHVARLKKRARVWEEVKS